MPLVVDPFAPGKLGPLTLRNRIIKAATFEGRTPHRVVTDELIDFHRAVAAGGVGMTTVAYCAISREGTTDGHQIVLTEDAVAGLRRLTDAIHGEGAAASAQIGHAGPVANPAGTRRPALAPSRFLTPFMRRTKAMTESDFERITDDFVRGARTAVESGFDALEIHLGHNYLLSSFLSPKLNKRSDDWGGTLENRARFPRDVLRAVRKAAGPAALIAKLNMDDGVAGGFQPDESLRFAQMLQDDGTIDALELTGGSSLNNPMYLFKGEAPLREFGATLPPVMRLGFRLVGHRLFRSYPFEEAYFRDKARAFKDALELPVILLGGINRVETIREAMDEGFAFVAMARALLSDPGLVNKMRAGEAAVSPCDHRNRCLPTIYAGTRCLLVGNEEERLSSEGRGEA
jgi:2,4-dienoyl-CoA reductase-like NADH-dependent reductase (Old Yellow Enzyme family)